MTDKITRLHERQIAIVKAYEEAGLLDRDPATIDFDTELAPVFEAAPGA
jgi:hypothetical protein